MKVLFVAFSFSRGGAAIAARDMLKVASSFCTAVGVCAEESQVSDVVLENPGRLQYVLHCALRMIEYTLQLVFCERNVGKQSSNLFSSSHVASRLNNKKIGADVTHIHWFNNCTISLFRLRSLPDNTIITLHDEWMYSGTFSYGFEGRGAGSIALLRAKYSNWIQSVKDDALGSRQDIVYTVPSEWMRERAKSSKLLGSKDVRVVRNVVNPTQFYSYDSEMRELVRSRYGIPGGVTVLGFGAIDSEKNPLKGAAYLRSALELLAGNAAMKDVVLLVFGAGSELGREYAGFRVLGLGHVSGRDEMRDVYNACDFVVVPSLRESFGLVAAESLLCERPVVAFEKTAVENLVADGESGFIARYRDAGDLAEKIGAMVKVGAVQRSSMGARGRQTIVDKCSPAVAATVLSELYDEVSRRA